MIQRNQLNMELYLILAAILFMTNSAMSLSCYQGDGSTKFTCPSAVKAKYCAKITLEATKIAGYSCLAEPHEQLGLDKSTIKDTLACYKVTVPKELKGEVCYCTKDNCNDPKASTSNSLKTTSSSSSSSSSSSGSSSTSTSSSDASSKNSTALKCYQGTTCDSPDCKIEPGYTCRETDDRCWTQTTNAGTRSGCFNSTQMNNETMIDNNCKTIKINTADLKSDGKGSLDWYCINIGTNRCGISGLGESEIKTCICNADNCNQSSEIIGPIMQPAAQIVAIILFSSIFGN